MNPFLSRDKAARSAAPKKKTPSPKTGKGKLRGKAALLGWCKKHTKGYPGVDVQDFSTTWKDGLAFCAIMHRFAPGLIDFNSLSSVNPTANLNLAFKVAEDEFDIYPIIDAEDITDFVKPDPKVVTTCLASWYGDLKGQFATGSPGDLLHKKDVVVPKTTRKSVRRSVRKSVRKSMLPGKGKKEIKVADKDKVVQRQKRLSIEVGKAVKRGSMAGRREKVLQAAADTGLNPISPQVRQKKSSAPPPPGRAPEFAKKGSKARMSTLIRDREERHDSLQVRVYKMFGM